MIRSAAQLGRRGIGGTTAGARLWPPTSVPVWRSLGIHQRPPQPSTVKVLVTGGVGVGKTTLIATVSQRPPHTTDVAVTAAPGRHTTAAGETGWLRLNLSPDTSPETSAVSGVDLHLVGTPGHPRYHYLWPELASGARAALILVDPDRLADAFPALDACDHHGLPYIVATTAPTTLRNDDIRDALALPAGTLVLHCDTQKRASVHHTLRAAAQHLGLIQPAAEADLTPPANSATAEHGTSGAVAAPALDHSPQCEGAP